MERDEPFGLTSEAEQKEIEAQMERLQKESARLRLDWYATDAILNPDPEN